jgi:hypothetical protein
MAARAGARWSSMFKEPEHIAAVQHIKEVGLGLGRIVASEIEVTNILAYTRYNVDER